jgi:hypothetical protein
MQCGDFNIPMFELTQSMGKNSDVPVGRMRVKAFAAGATGAFPAMSRRLRPLFSHCALF